MKEKLRDQLKTAMRAKDQIRLNTIRALISAVQYEEEAQKTDSLPEASYMELFKREIKKRKEELDFAEKAERTETVQSLKSEIAIVEEFLPQQLSAVELEKIITDMKSSNAALNMGGVMKALKDGYAGKFDSKMASELAKKIAG